MLSFGKEARSYSGIRLKGKRSDDGNVFIGLMSPPFRPMDGFHYVLAPQGKVISFDHGY
jgi:hypothetical protein